MCLDFFISLFRNKNNKVICQHCKDFIGYIDDSSINEKMTGNICNNCIINNLYGIDECKVYIYYDNDKYSSHSDSESDSETEWISETLSDEPPFFRETIYC